MVTTRQRTADENATMTPTANAIFVVFASARRSQACRPPRHIKVPVVHDVEWGVAKFFRVRIA